MLESTDYGGVLARRDVRSAARIYVKGLFVAEEPNFLFSYNITKPSAALRRALNRERSNLGRGAYSDRVKAILTACWSTEVAGLLAEDLNGYTSGRLHDELGWRDVAVHACRVLQTNEKVMFVTAWQMAGDTAQLRYARDDGYRIVVVPEDIARSLGGLTDLNGRPLIDLDRYRNEWNESFSFTFVEAAAMTPAERAAFGRTQEIGALAGVDLARRNTVVLISGTMRLNETGNPVLGIWEAAERRIVIRRDQLGELTRYGGYVAPRDRTHDQRNSGRVTGLRIRAVTPARPDSRHGATRLKPRRDHGLHACSSVLNSARSSDAEVGLPASWLSRSSVFQTAR